MLYLKVDIVGYLDNSQPGWIKCIFKDAEGKEWNIVEKVPVISDKELDEQSQYPQSGLIAGCIKEGNITDEVLSIDLSWPWGVSSETGETIFKVFRDQLVK